MRPAPSAPNIDTEKLKLVAREVLMLRSGAPEVVANILGAMVDAAERTIATSSANKARPPI
jgi:hypothetical protein